MTTSITDSQFRTLFALARAFGHAWATRGRWMVTPGGLTEGHMAELALVAFRGASAESWRQAQLSASWSAAPHHLGPQPVYASNLAGVGWEVDAVGTMRLIVPDPDAGPRECCRVDVRPWWGEEAGETARQIAVEEPIMDGHGTLARLAWRASQEDGCDNAAMTRLRAVARAVEATAGLGYAKELVLRWQKAAAEHYLRQVRLGIQPTVDTAAMVVLHKAICE